MKNDQPIRIVPQAFTPGSKGHGRPYFDALASFKCAINGCYPVTANTEFSVDIKGNSFLVIYGTHINGGFCCIPNWQFGCEMGPPDDISYNAEMLSRRFDPETAKVIACSIQWTCTRTNAPQKDSTE